MTIDNFSLYNYFSQSIPLSQLASCSRKKLTILIPCFLPCLHVYFSRKKLDLPSKYAQSKSKPCNPPLPLPPHQKLQRDTAFFFFLNKLKVCGNLCWESLPNPFFLQNLLTSCFRVRFWCIDFGISHNISNFLYNIWVFWFLFLFHLLFMALLQLWKYLGHWSNQSSSCQPLPQP